ncbi:MAG: hypothetical protein JXI33_04960 [Candidatus Aminicenantes bacterium]|nr:hypothetical protein [Candidatus Aminicenantes bacterium]
MIKIAEQELPLPKPKRKKSAKRKPKMQKINDNGALLCDFSEALKQE